MSLKKAGPMSFCFATFNEVQRLKHTLLSVFNVNFVSIVKLQN